MKREIAREIMLNLLGYLNNIPAEKCKKYVISLLSIDSKYGLNLKNNILYHIIKDDVIKSRGGGITLVQFALDKKKNVYRMPDWAYA